MNKKNSFLRKGFIQTFVTRFLIGIAFAVVGLYVYFTVCYYHDEKQVEDKLQQYGEYFRKDVQKKLNDSFFEMEEDYERFVSYIFGTFSQMSRHVEINSLLPGGKMIYSLDSQGLFQRRDGAGNTVAMKPMAYLTVEFADRERLEVLKEGEEEKKIPATVLSCPYEEIKTLVEEYKKTNPNWISGMVSGLGGALGEAMESVWIKGNEFRPNVKNYSAEGYVLCSQTGAAYSALYVVDSAGTDEKTKQEAEYLYQNSQLLYGIHRVQEPDRYLPFYHSGMRFFYKNLITDPLGREYELELYWRNESFFETNKKRILSVIAVVLLAILYLAARGSVKWLQKQKNQLAMESYTRTLVNSMAHDLKTPLTVISAFTENIKEKTHPEKQDYYVDEIQNNAAYMNEIIGKNLELFQMESTGMLMEKVPLDLVELCKKRMEQFEALCSEKKITVIFKGKYKVKANELWMERAIDNLLSNCMKYTREGGLVEMKGSTHFFVIKNTTDMEYKGSLSKLWDPFVMGDESRTARNGTGLGLAIVRSVLMRHKIKHFLVYDKKWKTFKVVFWRL